MQCQGNKIIRVRGLSCGLRIMQIGPLGPKLCPGQIWPHWVFCHIFFIRVLVQISFKYVSFEWRPYCKIVKTWIFYIFWPYSGKKVLIYGPMACILHTSKSSSRYLYTFMQASCKPSGFVFAKLTKTSNLTSFWHFWRPNRPEHMDPGGWKTGDMHFSQVSWSLSKTFWENGKQPRKI